MDNKHDILALLRQVAGGEATPEQALTELKRAPFEDLGYAKVDFHRSVRQGTAEVVYGAGKTPEQIIGIVSAMGARGCRNIMVTRIGEEAAQEVAQAAPLEYHPEARFALAFPGEQKRLGKIRYFGFSFHGSPDALEQMLARGPWDFVQIQLNYYDWFHGTARALYEILRGHDIPIMVMEPVHGGMLADLPEAGRNLLLTAKPGATAASWAFQFLRTLPGIAVVLSGMSSLEQVKDNVQTFSHDKPLSEQEITLVRQVSDVIHGLYAVPCTGCRYCCADCPQQLDIPFLLAAFNEYKTGGEKDLSSWRLARLNALPEDKRPSACIGCGACTAHCPQGLEVPAYMKEMASFL